MSGEITLNEVAYSFNAALECLGDVVRDVIYSTLEKNGIGVQDIPLRIPDVVAILRKTIGGTTGLIVHRMLAEFRSERVKARMRHARGDYVAETSLGIMGTSLTTGPRGQLLVPPSA